MKTRPLWILVLSFMLLLVGTHSAHADEMTITLQGDTPSLWSWYQRQGDEYKTTHPWLRFLRNTCAASSIEQCNDLTFRNLPVGAKLKVAAPLSPTKENVPIRNTHKEASNTSNIKSVFPPSVRKNKALDIGVGSSVSPSGSVVNIPPDSAIQPLAFSADERSRKQDHERIQNAAFINGSGFLLSSFAVVFLLLQNQRLRFAIADQVGQTEFIGRRVKKLLFEMPRVSLDPLDEQDAKKITLEVVGSKDDHILVSSPWSKDPVRLADLNRVLVNILRSGENIPDAAPEDPADNNADEDDFFRSYTLRGSLEHIELTFEEYPVLRDVISEKKGQPLDSLADVIRFSRPQTTLLHRSASKKPAMIYRMLAGESTMQHIGSKQYFRYG